MAKNSKYSNIKSIEDLDRALDGIKSGIDGKSVLMKSDYNHMKSFYTPANLFNYTVDKVSPVFNLTGLALELYDRIKERIDETRDQIAARRAAREKEKLAKQYVAPEMKKEAEPETKKDAE